MHVLRSAMMSATPAPVGLGTWEGEPGVKAGGRVGRESAVRLQRGRYVLSRTNPPPVALWDLEDILGGTLSIRCTRCGCAGNLTGVPVTGELISNKRAQVAGLQTWNSSASTRVFIHTASSQPGPQRRQRWCCQLKIPHPNMFHPTQHLLVVGVPS